jgi:pimeloyl-ACP methyl ester carboxylesterase
MDYPNVASQAPLSSHRRILVDLLGAGFSDKPDDFGYAAEDHAEYLLNFVETLELDTFVLFGHSMGGAVAISLARLCPERIKHLILTESNLDPSPESAVSNQIASQSKEEFLSSGFESMVQRAIHSGNTLWAASLSLWSPVAAYGFSCSGKNGGAFPGGKRSTRCRAQRHSFLVNRRCPIRTKPNCAATACGWRLSPTRVTAWPGKILSAWRKLSNAPFAPPRNEEEPLCKHILRFYAA